MTDISGVGVLVNIVATNSFPAGFTVQSFSDDADALDFSTIKIADTAMGLNGDLLSWSKAVPIPFVVNVVPGSDDDKNLDALFNANRVAKGKRSAQDEIYATIVYPSGEVVNLLVGKCTDFMPALSISSQGRQKTRTYAFAFQDKA